MPESTPATPPQMPNPADHYDPVGGYDISEVIGNSPGWLVRSGIGMVGIAVATLLFIANFIQYPDKILGRATMTSTTPPIELVSRSQGYIEDILINEDELVQSGDEIIYINNTTNPEEVKRLTDWIRQYESIRYMKDFANLKIPSNLQVGVLQSDYAILYLKYNELRQNLNNSLVGKRVKNLNKEIDKIHQLNKSKEKEKELYKKELELSKKDYQRTKGLYESEIISEVDLEKVNAQLLQYQRIYEGMENSIIQNNIRIEQLKMEQLSMNSNRTELINNNQLAIAESIARIRTNIQVWSETYTIKSPIDGKISFNNNTKENKTVAVGQILGYIIPEDSNEKYLSCLLPTTNIGKIGVGKKSLVKFDAYPYKEFGLYVSKVESISNVPEVSQENFAYYEVILPLPEPIITDVGDTIPYLPNMTATVEIITEDKSILGRIFDQILSLINSSGKEND